MVGGQTEMASRTVKKREKRYTAEEATRLVLEEIDIGDDGKINVLMKEREKRRMEDLSLNVFNSTEVDEALSLISNVNEIFNMPHPNYDERYRVPHFMSCDSFHHLIEDNIRHEKYLYDFNDYVQCVEKAGSAIEVKPSDFLDLKSKKGVGKDTRYFAQFL